MVRSSTALEGVGSSPVVFEEHLAKIRRVKRFTRSAFCILLIGYIFAVVHIVSQIEIVMVNGLTIYLSFIHGFFSMFLCFLLALFPGVPLLIERLILSNRQISTAQTAETPNHDVINRAVSWTLSEDGELFGTISGDMDFASAGIRLDPETTRIWRSGVALQEVKEADTADAPAWLTDERASAWADGYNALLRRLRGENT